MADDDPVPYNWPAQPIEGTGMAAAGLGTATFGYRLALGADAGKIGAADLLPGAAGKLLAQLSGEGVIELSLGAAAGAVVAAARVIGYGVYSFVTDTTGMTLSTSRNL